MGGGLRVASSKEANCQCRVSLCRDYFLRPAHGLKGFIQPKCLPNCCCEGHLRVDEEVVRSARLVVCAFTRPRARNDVSMCFPSSDPQYLPSIECWRQRRVVSVLLSVYFCQFTLAVVPPSKVATFPRSQPLARRLDETLHGACPMRDIAHTFSLPRCEQ